MESNATESHESEATPISVTIKPTQFEEQTPAEPATPEATSTVSSSEPTASTPETSDQQTVSSGDDGSAITPPKPAKAGSGKRKKTLMIAVVVALLLGGSASAYYFGYYNNPVVVYSQSLTNTGKAYETLTNFLDDQSKLGYKGYTGSGSYTVGSGGFATDGKLTFNSDGANSDATADINLGTTRLGLDFRAIQAKTVTPDLYFKASGLSGLSSLVGPTYAGIVGKYDNQWIVVDPSLLSSLQHMSGTGAAATSPTHDQLLDEAQAFGRVNRDYVFTNDASKSVTTVVKTIGSEEVDGHKTVHYQVAFVKDNVKKYITAQRDALKASKLGAWIKQNNYNNAVDLAYDSLQQSAESIKSSDTLDVWMDSSQRILYKIRVADPKKASNYADFGFDFKGGSQYPFFVKFSSEDSGGTTTGSFVTTLNTDDSSVKLTLDAKQAGKTGFNLKANLVLKPSNNVAAITAPTGSKPLTQVLHELGLGSYLSLLSGASSATTPSTTSASTSAAQKCAAAYEAWANSNGTGAIPAECN